MPEADEELPDAEQDAVAVEEADDAAPPAEDVKTGAELPVAADAAAAEAAEEEEEGGGGDELSFDYSGDEMEDAEEVTQEESRPTARLGKQSGDDGGGGAAAASASAGQAAGLPRELGGLPAPPGRRQRGGGQQRQPGEASLQWLERQRPPGMQGHDRYGGGPGRPGPDGMQRSDRMPGMGRGGANGMAGFPPMPMPGMLGGVPMVGNRPMTREEFERLRAMNGHLARAGTPGAIPLGPGIGPGLPLLVDPSTVAALGGILPFDPSALPRPGPANGLPGGGLEALLPGPMAGGQMRRPGQQQQQQSQQQSMPLGGGGPWLAGANGRAMIPMPRPPPGQPLGSRARGLDGGGNAGPGLRAVGGGAEGPESPANRHALHVWERDSHAGGLPPPPQGFNQQQQQPAGPRPPPQQPTAEELAKRKADMEKRQLMARMKLLERNNARRAAIMAKREVEQAKVAAKLKAAQLAAEIAEMKRKIQVQELRQAGKPVPPELLVPIKAPQAAEAAAAHADSGDGAEATAQEVSAPTAAGAAARAAALGRWAGDTDEDAGPAEGEQAAVSAAAGDAPMVSSSVPADPPVAAETAPHHRAQHVGPDADAMPADDDDWPDPQDDDWGTPAEPKPSSGSKRRHKTAVAADHAPALGTAPGVSHEPAEAVAAAHAAPAAEALAADEAPAEKRQKSRRREERRRQVRELLGGESDGELDGGGSGALPSGGAAGGVEAPAGVPAGDEPAVAEGDASARERRSGKESKERRREKEKRKHKSKRSRHEKSALPNGSRRHGSRRPQEDESTPERLDSVPDVAPAAAGADPVIGSDKLAIASDPEAAPAGDLRQQLEARRRARAGH